MINIKDFLKTAEGEVTLSQALEQATRIASQRHQEQGLAEKPVVVIPVGQYLVEETIDLSSGSDVVLMGEHKLRAK